MVPTSSRSRSTGGPTGADRIAVNRCEFDQDAVLLTARRSRSVLERAGFGHVDHRYIFFVPLRHRAARAADRPLGSIPMGAQYLAVGTA